MLRTVTMALLLRLARPLHTRRLTRLYADVRPGADYVPLTPEELIPKSPEMVVRATRVKEEHPERFITPADAAEMLRKGAALVDVRTEQVLEHEVTRGRAGPHGEMRDASRWTTGSLPGGRLRCCGRWKEGDPGVHGRAVERAGRNPVPVRRLRAVPRPGRLGRGRARAGGRVRGGRTMMSEEDDDYGVSKSNARLWPLDFRFRVC